MVTRETIEDGWDPLLTRDEETGFVTELNILRAFRFQWARKLPFHFDSFPHLRVLNLSCSRMDNFPPGLDHLVNLQELLLQSCSRLTTLPEDIGALTSLTKLDLSYCGSLSELPPSIVRLSNLKHWEVSKCKNLSNLPADIGALKALEFLSLSDCTSLQTIPPSIARLTNLRELAVAGCDRIFALPDQVCDLPNLEQLTFGYNTMDGAGPLPPTIGRLQTLKKLKVLNAELPPEIWTLKKLQVLDLSSFHVLTSLPRPVNGCQLASLKELDLTGCQKLASLPREMEELVQLEKLKLRDSLFASQITIDIGRLSNLKEMELGREIPQERDEDNEMEIVEQTSSIYDIIALQIGQLQNLESLTLVASERLWESMMEKESLAHLKRLRLTHYGSTKLPWSNMRCLESIFLDGCHDILSLPSEIGLLPNLVELDMRCDSLQALPMELTQLSKLEEFCLSSESLSEDVYEDELQRILTTIPKSVTHLALDLSVEESFMDKFVTFELPPHLCILTLSNCVNVSLDHLFKLLRDNPCLSEFGMQDVYGRGNKEFDLLMDRNYFRSLWRDKNKTMPVAMWPLVMQHVMQQVNKRWPNDKAGRASVMHEMFQRSLYYNILPSPVDMDCPEDSMECDDVNSMQLDDNDL